MCGDPSLSVLLSSRASLHCSGYDIFNSENQTARTAVYIQYFTKLLSVII